MPQIDILKIKEIFLTLARDADILPRREFLQEIELIEPRIKVIRGFRGIGKTTALLQIAKNLEKAIYFSVDHPYVEQYSLYDVAKEAIRSGHTTLCIDEIHHYKEWKRDTKALYDEFKDVLILASGSAPLAFEPERRYEIIEASAMSLKEHIKLNGKTIDETESWQDIEKTIKFISENSWIEEYYRNYMNGGAFPIFLSYKEKTLAAIYHSIRKSIREDSQFFANVDGESIRAMERILIFLASASLGDFSANNLAKHVEISKYKCYEIIALLEAMKILRIIRPYGRGSKLIRGEPKLMFSHPNLRSAVCEVLGVKPDIGALREELAVFCFKGRGWNVSTIKGMKRKPDYIIEKNDESIIVEIGGDGKNQAQLAGFNQKKLLINDRQLITLATF